MSAGVRTIVVDGLAATRGGGVTYLNNLFARCPAGPDLRVVALLPAGAGEGPVPGPGVEVVRPGLAGWGVPGRALWYHLGLPRLLRRLDADLLYCPGGMLPPVVPAGVRTAVAFRNMLIFAPQERRRFPWGYVRARLWLLSRLQARSFRRADLVVFVSAHARAVVEAALPGRRGGALVVPHGVEPRFRVAGSGSPLPYAYVLYVSILDFYKAQLEVVRAWHLLCACRPTPERLVLAGPHYPPYARRVRALVAELGLDGRVVLAGPLSHRVLPAWYRHARLNLFASSCENCPNVLLEALAAGRPLLCSAYPPMPELAGEGAAYFDPYDPAGLAALLARFLDDAALRRAAGARAARRALAFSWERTAARTWEALAALAGQGRHGGLAP